MRRHILSLALCGLLMLPASLASARAGHQSQAATVNLTYALWDKNQQPALQKIIDQFQNTHPTIHVTIQQTPWAGYWDKLSTLTAGGIDWDVFWMNGPYFPTYASKKALLNLDPYLKSADYSGLPSSLVQLYTSGGHHYGLVLNMDTIGLWYNKTLFDRAHVSYPTCNWTWQDFANAARKLAVKKNGRTVQYGTIVDSPHVQELWGDIFAAYGGSILNKAQTRSVIASPQNITAANLLTSLIADGSALGSPSTGLDRGVAFTSGKIAMLTDGSWQVAPFTTGMKNYKIGVTCIPSGPKGRFTIIHGVGDVVSARTKHPKEAAELVAYLSGSYSAKVQGQMATGLPALKGSQQPWIATHPELDLKIFPQEASEGVQFPVSLGFSEWYTALQSDLDLMVLRKKTPKQALTDAQQKINTILTKYYPKG